MALAQRQSGQPESGIDVPGVTRPMTYDEYLATPEEMARYDILDGWKVYRLYGEEQLTNPTIRHQKIERNIARVFEDYETAMKSAWLWFLHTTCSFGNGRRERDSPTCSLSLTSD